MFKKPTGIFGALLPEFRILIRITSAFDGLSGGVKLAKTESKNGTKRQKIHKKVTSNLVNDSIF
jgi:hypothetical protein